MDTPTPPPTSAFALGANPHRHLIGFENDGVQMKRVTCALQCKTATDAARLVGHLKAGWTGVRAAGDQVHFSYPPDLVESLIQEIDRQDRFNPTWYTGGYDTSYCEAQRLLRDEYARLWHQATDGLEPPPRKPQLSVRQYAATMEAFQSFAWKLLDSSFVLGEEHGTPVALRFLSENMAQLKAEGFDTIYTEFQFIELQPWLNHYLAGGDVGAIPFAARPVIEGRAVTWWSNMVELLQCARQHGMRVIAIDSWTARPAVSRVTFSSDPKRTDTRARPKSPRRRVAAMNYIATSVILADQQANGKGKYVVHVGNNHARLGMEESKEVVKGIACPLQLPTVFLTQAEHRQAHAQKFTMLSSEQVLHPWYFQNRAGVEEFVEGQWVEVEANQDILHSHNGTEWDVYIRVPCDAVPSIGQTRPASQATTEPPSNDICIVS